MTKRERAHRAIQLSKEWNVALVAKALDESYDSVYSWLTERREPKKENADIFDRILALVGEEAEESRLVPLRPSMQTVKIPIVGTAHAGRGESEDIQDELEVPAIFSHPEYRGWIVSGDSMADRILPRDTVIIHAMDDARPGVVSLIRLGQETVLKRIKWSQTEGWIMESHNPAYPPAPLPADHQVRGFMVGWFRHEPGGFGFEMAFDPTGRKFGAW